MFMTATPVAAALPRGEFSEISADENGTAPVPDEAHRIGTILANLVPDGNVRAMEALAVVILRSDWGHICAAASTLRPLRSSGAAMHRAIAAG
jgi:hypothetical protein